MPLRSSVVGTSISPIKHWVDARWTMAYAAALNDPNPRYFRQPNSAALEVHPLFTVCLEWPAVLALRALVGGATLLATEVGKTLHATHDVEWRHPIRPDVELTTHATLVQVEQRKPGVYQRVRLETFDPNNNLCVRTYHGTLWPGVQLVAGDANRSVENAVDAPRSVAANSANAKTMAERSRSSTIAVLANLAHVYSECARIWNPIHTDRVAAQNAGLSDIILHGTATLALATTRLVNDHLAGDPSRLRRVGGRFRAQVFMPSTLQLVVEGRSMRVLTDQGEAAIDNGFFETI